MNAFRVNVAGWICQIAGTLFLLLDSIRIGVRLPREGVTLGNPPAIDKWYYHWASPVGFFLLLVGFGLSGAALWISRPRQAAAPDAPAVPGGGGAAPAAEPDGDGQLLEIRTNYWLKRLDHTLTHTQNASRLIYIADGAVLAMMYFAVQSLGTARQVILLMCLPALLLALFNFLHARLVLIQRSHYLGINARLRGLLDQQEIEHQTPRHYLASTHRLYSWMHVLIGSFLVAIAVVMFLYGWYGWFAEI